MEPGTVCRPYVEPDNRRRCFDSVAWLPVLLEGGVSVGGWVFNYEDLFEILDGALDFICGLRVREQREATLGITIGHLEMFDGDVSAGTEPDAGTTQRPCASERERSRHVG